MTAMPTGVAEGFVVARFLLITADGSDPGSRPDAIAPAQMKVRFTPKDRHIRLTDPESVVLTKQEVLAEVDSNGYLTDSTGTMGIYLTTGIWTVVYESALAGLPMHDIEVTSEHTEANPLELVSYQPAPGTAPSPSQYSYLISLVNAVSSTAVRTVNGVAPDSSGEVTVVGETGPPGPAGAHGEGTVLNVTGNEPRPAVTNPVIWLWGTTRPLNIEVGDVWITSETPAPPIPQRPESLVADYPFSENTGSVAASTTSSPDITSIPGWTTRLGGSAMLSQPTGGGSMSALGTSFGSGGTVMFWIRPDAMPAESAPALLRSLDGGVVGLMYRFSGQHVLYVSPGDYLALEGAPIAEGVWSHFAITQSPPDVNNGYAVTNNFYVNSTLAETKVGQAFIPSTAGVWEIGGNAVDGGAMGIDDLRLWSVELTALEIAAEMDR